MKKVLRNLIIVIMVIIPIVEGGFIIHLYKKPQIVIKAVYEQPNELDNLPTVPKETNSGNA